MVYGAARYRFGRVARLVSLRSPAVKGFCQVVPCAAKRPGSNGARLKAAGRPVSRSAMMTPVMAAQEKPLPLKPAASV